MVFSASAYVNLNHLSFAIKHMDLVIKWRIPIFIYQKSFHNYFSRNVFILPFPSVIVVVIIKTFF